MHALGWAFLAQNVRDTEWQDPMFEAYRIFEKGGVKIAVIGQAFLSLPKTRFERDGVARQGLHRPRWLPAARPVV